jgi:hypothetical protein
MKDIIEEICREIGPRPSGSPAEEKAARLVRDRLESWGLKTEMQSFSIAPRALQILFILVFLGFAFCLHIYLTCPPLALLTLLLLLAVYLSHMAFGADLMKHVFRKSPSWNVVGRIEPEGKAERLIIFSGHLDSAYRMPLLQRKTYWIVFVLVPLYLLSLVLLLGLSGWKSWMMLAHVPVTPTFAAIEQVLFWICAAGSVAGLVLLAGLIRADAVPGANDNLTGVAVAMEMGRELAKKKPVRTEIWVAAFGSEEAGLLGSRHMARTLGDEIRRKVGLVVNLESLGQSGTLRLVTGELMSAGRHSPAVLDLIESAAAAARVPMKRFFLAAGLTDAASFSRRKIPAATVIRLDDHGLLDHYHNPGDNPDSVEEGRLDEALKVCRAIVDRVDSKA